MNQKLDEALIQRQSLITNSRKLFFKKYIFKFSSAEVIEKELFLIKLEFFSLFFLILFDRLRISNTWKERPCW